MVGTVLNNMAKAHMVVRAEKEYLFSLVRILGPPRLLFTMTILFQNGDQMDVHSDQTWTGREGSIRHDNIYNGEVCDSRNDRLNWSRAGFIDTRSAWIAPESMRSPINGTHPGLLVLQDMPPIRAGTDALHSEILIDSLSQSYLKREEIGRIEGASLMDGGILKPIATWVSDSGMFTIDREIGHRHKYS